MGSFHRSISCSFSVRIFSQQVHPSRRSYIYTSCLCLHRLSQQEDYCNQEPKQYHQQGTAHINSSNSSEGKWFHLIKSCCTKKQLLQLHGHLILTSLIKDVRVSVALLSNSSLYTALDTDVPQLVFNQIQTPSVYHYYAMIKGYSKSILPSKVLCLYNNMRKHGHKADIICVSFVVKACCRMSCLFSGKQLHGRILQDGQQYDSLLLTSLMDLYASSGNGADAQTIFYELPSRDTVAWNVLISCYIKNGRTRDVLRLFDTMQLPPFYLKPDDVTCLLMLQACAKLNAFEFGERIHKYIEEHDYGSTLKVRNSLVAMYSKCGSVDKAFGVFRDTFNKNVVTWSALISGLAMNGYGNDALEAFRKMQRCGVKPDEQTLTGVLTACSHSAMVDEGLKIFNSMTSEYGLYPNVRHYGCVVHLLGRVGLLDKAYGLITKMNVKPDSIIWRTLLGACRIHGHYNLGERVISHLIELKAQEAGDYVLLLNIYASAGNWEKVTELRKLLKDKEIQTSPGCSTMELRGVVYEFVAGDTSHPRKIEIFKMLDEIRSQLKLGGYTASVEAELHYLDDEKKEYVLSFHSEKLAVAFGVLATPPGTTIRIANNLRICVDCHNFLKTFSSVYNRKVIVRDRGLFHHFREGYCSCKDYW